MTETVVQFEPVAARRAAKRAGVEVSSPMRDCAETFAPGDEFPESLGDFQREVALALRVSGERHLAGLARLASCRTPAQLVTAQAATVTAAVAGALADSARLCESWARLNRVAARIYTGALR